MKVDIGVIVCYEFLAIEVTKLLGKKKKKRGRITEEERRDYIQPMVLQKWADMGIVIWQNVDAFFGNLSYMAENIFLTF